VDAPAEQPTVRALLAALEAPERAADLARLDAGTLLRVARHHRLTPLLSVMVGDRLTDAFAEACRQDRTVTATRNLLLAQVAEECLAALARRRIDGVLLKGLAYEPFLYDRPGCRPTGDIDILVRGEHRRAACETLADAGFEPKAAAPGVDEPDYHEIGWSRGPIAVDLHLGLAPRARCSIDYGAVWGSLREVPFGAVRAFLLAPDQAAVFHTLHMAIDHFDVPALYLVDLARLLPAAPDTAAAEATARRWRCERGFVTALALAADFLPVWAARQERRSVGPRARRVLAGFGGLAPLPRTEQLRRKVSHIDTPGAALRYLAVQARRNVREIVETKVLRRSPRERLDLRK